MNSAVFAQRFQLSDQLIKASIRKSIYIQRDNEEIFENNGIKKVKNQEDLYLNNTERVENNLKK